MSNMTKIHSTVQSPRKSALRRYLTPRLNRFRQDEDGAVVAFTIYMFLVFMLMAGIGIDTMRHEMERTRLAAVADAASLAGAAAPNNDAAKAVVEDYFAKNGMSDYLDAFGPDDIQITLNTAKVSVNTSIDVETYLMRIMGIETLSAAAGATAEKRVPKLEISLVLDVSGSMRGDKLTNLKAAAKQFVTTIINSADAGDAVISIVPFSFGVTPPDAVYEALTVDETHQNSTCIVFSEDDFGDTAIDPDTTYAQQIYTSRYDVNGDFNTLSSGWRSCYDDDYFRFLPYSHNVTELHAKIESLEADGNTSGHLGIKWGAALLDPAFDDVAAVVNPDLANVPAEYNELETQKVIVMMGDGKNTTSYYFSDPNGLLDMDTVSTHSQFDYRGPNSDLHHIEYTEQVFDYAQHKYKPSKRSNSESKCGKKKWKCYYKPSNDTVSAYFLYDANDDRYWDIDNEEWMSPAEFADFKYDLANPVDPDDPTLVSEEQLSWEDAWGLMSPDYHSDITGSGAYSDYKYNNNVSGSMKNTRMSSACTAAKAPGKDIIIYTIGFEIDAGGTAETELKNCATSHSQYYRAEGVNINDAFNSIATNIQNLRLTQ
ncbi:MULTISPECIES: vWA domain-containing protein [unclassified Roseovarius]|uniref:vWA domain-containing protein n=1 Tax=unclassified Roseovarius TaxID=2614913 RepID=UPI00273FB440|nr:MULTISPECIES: vWA domain-containing protein [unclassified Roseovarius]